MRDISDSVLDGTIQINRHANHGAYRLKNHEGEIAVDLEPGDAMIYKGCDIEHWREPFHGVACAQVFYHYTDVNGDKFNPWDGRPHGGLPRGMKVSK